VDFVKVTLPKTANMQLLSTELAVIQLPLTPAIYDIDEAKLKNGALMLTCGTTDPHVTLPLSRHPAKPSGNAVVEMEYTCSAGGALQVFYDFGEGYSEERSTRLPITATVTKSTLHLPVIGWEKGKNLTAVRIDPPDGSEFVINSVKLRTTTLKINENALDLEKILGISSF
jgi:hypothetical protein